MVLSQEQIDEHEFDVPDLLDTIRAAWAERDAYKKAKQENDERFQTERDEARRALNAERQLMFAEYDRLQAKLDAANEQVGYYRAQLSDPVVRDVLRRKELGR
jgi:outer membrane protein TolC